MERGAGADTGPPHFSVSTPLQPPEDPFWLICAALVVAAAISILWAPL